MQYGKFAATMVYSLLTSDDANESALIRKMQEADKDKTFFVMRTHQDAHDSAWIWEGPEGSFVKYTKKVTGGFERTNSLLPPTVAKWDVITWISEAALHEFCAFPEYWLSMKPTR